MMNPLSIYGWTPELQATWQTLNIPHGTPGRVVADFGTSLKVALPEVVTAELSGKVARDPTTTPKVGDWVAVRVSPHGHAVIEARLPRHSEIARKAAGSKTTKQVIAANIDVAFVLLAVGNDFSVERLRRFLYQLSIDRIKPVIVLTKIDAISDVSPYLTQLESFDVPVVASAPVKGTGIREIFSFILPGQTAVLLGSSGVGKSTLTNRLLGESVQKTQAVRESDETGKHTTVHRELFRLPGGGLLIDMPGIRELQLWGTEEDLIGTFDDIVALTRQCKYTTCRHENEPGCAIQAALHSGQLEPSRYGAFLKMKNELLDLNQHRTAMRRSNLKTKRQQNT